MKSHKKEYNLLRGKKNAIQDLLCSLNLTAVFKGSFTATAVLLAAHIALWKRSTSGFAAGYISYKNGVMLLLPHLLRLKKTLS